MDILAETSTYTPSDNEVFMNPKQVEYFRVKLLNWEKELNQELSMLNSYALEMRSKYIADQNEAACLISDLVMIEKNKVRICKLLDKIRYSLKKITDGTYGFCEKTGKPISLKRLLSRPIANLCIEAQEEHENEILH